MNANCFNHCMRKPSLFGILALGCFLQLWCALSPVQAETLKYIKIGEHETSTRIVEAAKLRYVKIGEHETYTRVVFEFKEPVQFDVPQVKPGGRFSVVFVDTTTALPRQITLDATERVESIAFEQRESNLSAVVAMSFLQFRIKPFTLTDPERLVVDVYPVKPPVDTAQGNIVLKKMVFKDTPEDLPDPEIPFAGEALPAAAVEDAAPAVNGESQPERDVREDAALPAAVETEDTAPAAMAPLAPDPAPDPAPVPEPETAADIPGQSRIDSDGFSKTADAARAAEENLQAFLMPVLIALSIIIVLLLALIIFQKKRVPAPQTSETGLDALKTNADIIAAINERINREIQKFEKSGTRKQNIGDRK